MSSTDILRFLVYYLSSVVHVCFSADLESHVQELQDSNDTSSAEVLRLDQENQLLTAHIKKLQDAIGDDLETERGQLQRQVHFTCPPHTIASLVVLLPI